MDRPIALLDQALIKTNSGIVKNSFPRAVRLNGAAPLASTLCQIWAICQRPIFPITAAKWARSSTEFGVPRLFFFLHQSLTRRAWQSKQAVDDLLISWGLFGRWPTPSMMNKDFLSLGRGSPGGGGGRALHQVILPGIKFPRGSCFHLIYLCDAVAAELTHDLERKPLGELIV